MERADRDRSHSPRRSASPHRHRHRRRRSRSRSGERPSHGGGEEPLRAGEGGEDRHGHRHRHRRHHRSRSRSRDERRRDERRRGGGREGGVGGGDGGHGFHARERSVERARPSDGGDGGVDFRPSGALNGVGTSITAPVGPVNSGGGGYGNSGARAAERASFEFRPSGALVDAAGSGASTAAPVGPAVSGGGGGGGGCARAAERASFALSGALVRDAATGNQRAGVALKWTPPPDECMPDRRWRLFVFAGGAGGGAAPSDTLFLHRRASFLFARDAALADVHLAHASCSSQHAVLQFRRAADAVRPYVLDLESTHGTWLNGARAPPARYVELKAGDVLRFAHSTREFVLICEGDVDGGGA